MRWNRLLCCAMVLAAANSALADKVYWTDKNDGSIWRGDADGSGAAERLLSSSDGLIEPRGLGLDAANNAMYFADLGTATIYRADLDGGNRVALVNNPQTAALGDLELDLVNRHLYWCDFGNDTIWRANLDGNDQQLMYGGLSSPYYLELDVAGNQIYWGDLSNAIIHRAPMTGENAGGLPEDLITGLDHIRDIGLDLAGGVVYYNERDLGEVRSAPLSGVGAPTTVYTVGGGGKPHGMALDVDNEMVYWTTTGSDFIYRGPLDGSGLELLYTSPGAPWDIELQTIPEPTTLVLLLTAACCGLALRRRC